MDISFLKNLHLPNFSFQNALGHQSFAGIDIGSESVKIVELAHERDHSTLKTYGEITSAPQAARDTTFVAGRFAGDADEHVVNLIADLMREANVKTKHVVIGIPSTASFVTTIQLPFATPQEIEAAVPFEARKYVPIPIQEVALDWQIVEQDAAQKQVSVLLAAVPQQVIARAKHMAERLQLTLEAVEIESFSLVRSLLLNELGVVAILNFGGYVTTLTIAANRRMRINHNFGHGAREITKTLAHALSVSDERAEQLKRDVGLSERPEDREVAEVIGPIVDASLSDVERAIVNFNRNSEAKVEKIILVGGGANLSGLVEKVSGRFGIETAVGNPFSRITYPPFLKPMLGEIAPNFAVATGLSLRQLTGV